MEKKESLSLPLPLGLPTWEWESEGAEMLLMVYETLMKIIFPAGRVGMERTSGQYVTGIRNSKMVRSCGAPWTSLLTDFLGK